MAVEFIGNAVTSFNKISFEDGLYKFILVKEVGREHTGLPDY